MAATASRSSHRHSRRSPASPRGGSSGRVGRGDQRAHRGAGRGRRRAQANARRWCSSARARHRCRCRPGTGTPCLRSVAGMGDPAPGRHHRPPSPNTGSWARSGEQPRCGRPLQHPSSRGGRGGDRCSGHVLARSILDEAHDLNQAMLRAAQAPVSASTSLTMVAVAGTQSAAGSCGTQPRRHGLRAPQHQRGCWCTPNHFLSTPANLHDTELRNGPDTVIRYDMLRRKLAGRDFTTGDALDALSSHLMAGGGTCCHIDPSLPAAGQFQTLATVVLDVANGSSWPPTRVARGPPHRP